MAELQPPRSAISWLGAQASAMQLFVQRHPVLSLAIFTSLILGASWYLKRIRKRLPAKDIDLYQYKIHPWGTLMERLPYVVKSFISRTLWAPTLVWNVFNYYTMPAGAHDWWNQIDDTVILGALPFWTDVPALHQLGVRGVVNTCDEYQGPVQTYQQHGIQQLYIPVVDYTSPSPAQLDQAVTFIERYRQKGEKVYIHCKAGKGRSTTVCLCYVMKAHNLSAQQALRMIIDHRHQVTKYLWRRPVVIDFAARHGIVTEDPAHKEKISKD